MALRPAAPHYCPGCGGPNPRSRAETPCSFCGGPLVPLGGPDPRSATRCRRCAAANGPHARFCAQCGSGLAHRGEPTPGSVATACPGCGESTMVAESLASIAGRGAHQMGGCARCGGVWLARAVLDGILHEASTRASQHGALDPRAVARKQLATGHFLKPVVYRTCPECEAHMLRRNFAGCSGVIVDECVRHGTFFDAGELHDVLAFVQTGGLALASRQRGDEQARVARARTPVDPAGATEMFAGYGYESDSLTTGFARFVARWLSRTFA